jgi:hypothetical protein
MIAFANKVYNLTFCKKESNKAPNLETLLQSYV